MNETQLALGVLFVSPDFVPSQVCGVEICFCGVKSHAVNSRLGAILIILDALFKNSFLIDREDISPTCVVIERISVDIERRLLRC